MVEKSLRLLKSENGHEGLNRVHAKLSAQILELGLTISIAGH